MFTILQTAAAQWEFLYEKLPGAEAPGREMYIIRP